METNDFAVFILTHGRPDTVKTLKTLQKAGYSGKTYFIMDDEDKTVSRYINKYGESMVKIFDKKSYADRVDEGNNFDDRRTTTHARNACFQIARDLGITYFMVLDDDYTGFHYRYESKDGTKLKFISIDNFDKIISLYLEFYKSTNFKSIAFAQGGDFIGGVGNPYVKHRPLMRKCMNSFLCSTEREFWIVGVLNEDVNTYCILGSRGELFGTVPMINLVQAATQSQTSGMTDTYAKYGTYCKSFTTVMMCPSSVKVAMMHTNFSRIHHSIKWINMVPMIISEKHRKS